MHTEDGWIRAAGRVEAARRILVNGVVIAAVCVLLAAGGRYLVGRGGGGAGAGIPVEKPLPPPIPWDQVDQSVARAMAEARGDAETYAGKLVDLWIAEMMIRVDDDFLDWYFSYWTQQVLGLEGLFQYGVHFVFDHQPTAAERMTEQVQEEFAQRVLRPQVAQLTLERIVRNTATRYTARLREELDPVPETYQIPTADWDRYLEGVALTTLQSNGSREVPVTLKAVVASGAGGAALVAGRIGAHTASLSGSVLARSGGRAASGMAARTGGKVAAKAGGKFLGAIVGVGVVVWDVWDHHRTAQDNRPALRRALADYFGEIKDILIRDPEAGLMVTLTDLERRIVDRLPPPPAPAPAAVARVH